MFNSTKGLKLEEAIKSVCFQNSKEHQGTVIPDLAAISFKG